MTSYRQWAIYSILIIGLLATVATSASPNFIVADQSQMTFVGATTVRVFVRVDADAAVHADWLELNLTVDSITGPWTVVAVPDDPTWDVMSLEVGAIEEPIWYSHDTSECIPEDGVCEFGVSFDIPADQELRIQVDASLVAYGDPSFFFPEDRTFPPGSMISIGFDDASVTP